MGLVPISTNHARMPTVRKAAVARTHNARVIPAPVGGLNFRESLTAMPPQDALVLENWIPRSYGCVIRGGYRLHAELLPTPAETLVSFSAATAAASKFFACCRDGFIYDITASAGPAWTPVTTTPAIPPQVNPGRFLGVNFTTTGTHYFCMAGEGAGYLTYDTVGGWIVRQQGVAAGEVDLPAGVTLDMLDGVVSWKNQIIFIRANSTETYALPVNQVAGTATLFDFGPLFSKGGVIAGIAPWTVDTGAGLNDMLVIVSTMGDVLIYGGDGISATNFAIQGRWFVGRVPVGRRFLAPYAGDLALVSERGMTYLSEILRGEGFSGDTNVGRKINPTLARQVHTTLTQPYWELRYLPSERVLMINAPEIAARSDVQYAMDVDSTGWCTFGGMEAITFDLLFDEPYFADSLGNVWHAFDYETDGESRTGTPGTELTGEMQTAFVIPGDEPYRLNRFLQAYASFTALDAPKVRAQINTDWVLTAAPGAPGLAPAAGSRWDQALWDQAVWAPDSQTFKAWFGAIGIGYYGSLRMSTTAYRDTAFVSWAIVTEPGGIM